MAGRIGKTVGRVALGLTLDEVAERVGVHRETVAVWIRNGELQATKFGRGGKDWIQPRDMDRFVRSRRTS